jgi:hypothetical protein
VPLFVTELIKRRPQIGARSAAEIRPGCFQEAALEGEDGGVIDDRSRRTVALAAARPQQPIFDEAVRANQKLIARERRQRAVRGIAISRRAERQRLPPALFRLAEPVDPRACRRSEIADAVAGRQRRYRQKHARGAVFRRKRMGHDPFAAVHVTC